MLTEKEAVVPSVTEAHLALIRDRARGRERAFAIDDRYSLLAFLDDALATIKRLEAENERLERALAKLLGRYREHAMHGDCPHWNPETDPYVISAKSALEEKPE